MSFCVEQEGSFAHENGKKGHANDLSPGNPIEML
jgi:hypothetical protein